MNSQQTLLRWATVILIPSFTLAYFTFVPPKDNADRLINGIILACEAVFLFKFVLFAWIGHHLRDEISAKKQVYPLFIPIILLVAYTIYYFQAA
ncbi:MAG: hypothetical protein Q4B82_04345 [Alysiella sp.]|uniref:hypothetical protein n=1 Tax=Alysiella sp. TaxID=1872483 RepID=UPI0026DBDE0F|nr:hypothetical protein [Alysiella sp.]MDO4433792.1 hypothetical protein [Alysiella sp.]